jgi:heme-degrading monooxygenase HmoA
MSNNRVESNNVTTTMSETDCSEASSSPSLLSSSAIAKTPRPPYFAVIFTSIRRTHADYTDINNNNKNNNNLKKDDTCCYGVTANRMMELAEQADGFLGVESVREETTSVGITVSYWRDLTSIQEWKQHSEHLIAQEHGKKEWYSAYTTRICQVERDYSLSR